MSVQLETICVGPLEVNCYIAGCDVHNVCAVIDPGDSYRRILETVSARGWKVTHIINTHAHADHTGANAQIKEATGAKIIIHGADAEMLNHPSMEDMAAYLGIAPSPPADELLADGDVVEICGCLKMKVIHTPGHSPGGICLLFGNTLIAGDTIFRLSIGRTDLPGGSFEALRDSINNRIFTLPPEVAIYPGHGDPTEAGFEKKNNPFIFGASK
ncbi:MAG: MBL fold metallo-hydrolase [Nitrospinae bacterium]|nr:MBL fold metallo-hydrolase [Nitrospinota bacterium]